MDEVKKDPRLAWSLEGFPTSANVIDRRGEPWYEKALQIARSYPESIAARFGRANELYLKGETDPAYTGLRGARLPDFPEKEYWDSSTGNLLPQYHELWKTGRAEGGRATNDWEDFLNTSGERLSDLGRTLSEAIYDPYKQLELARNVAEASGIAKGAGPLARAVAPLGNIDQAIQAARQYAPDPQTVSRYGHAFTDYFAPPSYAEEPLRRGYDEGGDVEEQSYLPTRDSIANALRTARQVVTHPVQSAQEYYRSLPTTLKPMLDIPETASPWEATKALGNYAIQQAPRPLEQSPTELAAGFMPLTGIFAGPKAKTANLKALAIAERLAKENAPKYGIFKKTGWFQGPEGGWRFEIPDNTARLDWSKMPETPERFDLAKQYFEKQGVPARKLFTGQFPNLDKEALSWADLQLQKIKTVPLSEPLVHPELFKAYPELSKIAVRPELSASYRGTFDPAKNEMSIGNRQNLITTNAEHPPISTALHETQHAIQQIEGLPRGGSPNDFLYQTDPLFKERKSYETPEAAYKRLAGEVEARNVQKRLGWDQAQRLATPPWESEDVSREMQILRLPEGESYAKGGEVEMDDNYNRLSALLRQVLGDEPVRNALATARSRETVE